MGRDAFATQFGRRFPLVTALARRTAPVAIYLSCVGATTWAGNLAVTDTAAFNGAYGLEVTVGSSCTAASDEVLYNDTVTGIEPFEGCNSITAGNDFVVASGGDATFTAGSWIALQNGFSVESGGTFTANIDPSMTAFAWVQDNSPNAEKTYNVQFYVNLDLFTLNGGDQLVHFVAYGGSTTEQLRLVITSGTSLVLEVRDDTGTYSSTSPVATASGWNKIDIGWAAAPGATASLTVNDGTPAQVTAATGTRRIDSVRWGAVNGTVVGSSGTIMQDEFGSWH
jgi:hypothetical protein